MDWQASLESTAAIVVGAFLLDLATGDPRWLPHPVVWMGKFISLGERLLWSGKPQRDFLAGVVVTIALVAVSTGATWALVSFFRILSPLLFFLFTVALASTTLATRGLMEAVGRVERQLRMGALTEARKELSHIVGRETKSLNEDKILRASLESLAENMCDGVVAPLFYLCLGGVPLAMGYKAVNTLDSMIGYRTERYLYFGRFAARLDDLMNYIPARLTALFIVVAAYLMRLDGGHALRVMRRDHGNHLSPNAGYPEAAFAGAFGIRLGGPSVYFGQEISKPHIGEETSEIHRNMLKEGRWLGLITATLSLITFLLLLRLSLGHF